MENSKEEYIPPKIEVIHIQMEGSMANSSAIFDPGGDQHNPTPDLENWIDDTNEQDFLI